MKTRNLILLLLASTLLSGCGSETTSKGTVTPPAAENFVTSASTGKKEVIDLTPYIYDKQGLTLSLSHVETDAGRCRASITGNSEITVHPLVNGLCDIKYTITNGVYPTSANVTVVSNNSGNIPFLTTISKSAQPNTAIDIDVLAELNALGVNTTGLTLMPKLSSSSGDASVSNNHIVFTPSLPGVTEIVYTLTDATGNIQAGTITVSVSASNVLPVALSYNYPTPIVPDTDVTVDIGQLKNQAGAPIISHPQNKPLQLVSIKAYGATARSAKPNDVTNTAFIVNVPNGVQTQDVTYTVTDHDGGYASNVIRFAVSSPVFAQTISITTNNATADGFSQNEAKVQVVDKKSRQPLQGAEVSWFSENGVVLTSSKSKTDQNGYASIAGTSTKSGSSRLTAQIGSVKTEAYWTFTTAAVTRTAFEFKQASWMSLTLTHDRSAPLWVDWGDGTTEAIPSGVKIEHNYTGYPSGTLAIEYYKTNPPNITGFDISSSQLGFKLQDLNTLPLTGSLKFRSWGNLPDATGSLADLPRTLTKDLIVLFDSIGTGQITGTINDIPKSLTGSVKLQTDIDGDLADLPTGLQGDLALKLKSTVTGNAASLPRGLLGALELTSANKNSPPAISLALHDLPTQLNTVALSNNLKGIKLREIGVSGSTSEIPRSATALDIQNSHDLREITLSGDVTNLPPTLDTLWLQGPGDIRLSGDIKNLPTGLKRFAIVDRFGRIIDEPAPFNDNNTLYGDITHLPQGMTFFKASGQNTITGDIRNIFRPAYIRDVDGRPSGMFISGSNTIQGDISDLKFYDNGYGWATVPVYIMGRGNKQLTGDLSDFKVISPVDENYSGNLTHLNVETPSELISFTCDLASLHKSNISSLVIKLTQQPCDNTLGNQLRLHHLQNFTINVTLNGRTNPIIPYSFVNDFLDAIIASAPRISGEIEIGGIDNRALVDQTKVDNLTAQGWSVNLF